MNKLHDAIMNIPCDLRMAMAAGSMEQAYKLGHRDARHAAAELVAAQASPPTPDAEKQP